MLFKAKKLLVEAKHSEGEPDIQKVITKRIEDIETKPNPRALSVQLNFR